MIRDHTPRARLAVIDLPRPARLGEIRPGATGRGGLSITWSQPPAAPIPGMINYTAPPAPAAAPCPPASSACGCGCSSESSHAKPTGPKWFEIAGGIAAVFVALDLLRGKK